MPWLHRCERLDTAESCHMHYKTEWYNGLTVGAPLSAFATNLRYDALCALPPPLLIQALWRADATIGVSCLQVTRPCVFTAGLCTQTNSTDNCEALGAQ